MLIKRPDLDHIENELKFTTSRSSGPGGQSVNKINTKVTLRWDIGNSIAINGEQRLKIMTTLAKVINNEGEVVITSQTNRSQLQNKQEVIAKLGTLLTKAFIVHKVRKATKPTKASKLKRLDEKKKQSIKKNLRRGIDD